MRDFERQFVIEQLAFSEARLLELVDGLTPSEWEFHELPERWSIAGNVEHLVVFEDFIRDAITAALERPAEPEKKALAAVKEPLVLGLANAGADKFNAREALLPAGRWPDKKELILEFRRTRAQTLVFASETELDLRDHFFPHIAFGDLDGYQWLVAIGQHTLRHCFQIREVKAHCDFLQL